MEGNTLAYSLICLGTKMNNPGEDHGWTLLRGVGLLLGMSCQGLP